MKTGSLIALTILASCAGGCATDTDGDAPAREESTATSRDALTMGTLIGSMTLPGCLDPSGFCVEALPAPAVRPYGSFDADPNGVYYLVYYPASDGLTERYRAVHVDWSGRVALQSRALPGRPSAIDNPVFYDGYYVFGDGSKNVVLDLWSSNAWFAWQRPWPSFWGIHGNGGLRLADGSFIATFLGSGGARGDGGLYGWESSLFQTDGCSLAPYDCQRPAVDYTPGAGASYVVAKPYGLQRRRVNATTVDHWDNYCSIPSSWPRLDPNAPVATAKDVSSRSSLHAAFRLGDWSPVLVDCRQDPAGATPVLRIVSVPGKALDFAYESNGDLWVAPSDGVEMILRKRGGSIARVALTSAEPGTATYEAYRPRYLKVLPDDTVIVLTRGDRFVRIRRAG